MVLKPQIAYLSKGRPNLGKFIIFGQRLAVYKWCDMLSAVNYARIS